MNGLAYISIGNIIEPQSLGREISRIGATSLEGFEKHLKLLTSLNVSSYINSITNNKRPALGLKYFDQSELIVINNPDFYFCFRGCDENLYYSEYLNDENLLSYNSSFGTTTTIAGKTVDFDSLQPVQDFSLIPGTTAVYETDDQLNSHDKAYSTRKLSGIFGGKLLSDTSAVSFVQSKHEGIGYTVACFATDKSALLMGAGLASNDGSAMMVTTLQQELAQGNYSDSGNTVIHNGVKYIQYSGGEMEAEKESKTGTWGRNKISVDERYAVEYTKDVFTLTIQNTGSYAYAVMGENTNEKYEVIVNSESVQAVIMPDGSLCAVFYKDTSFDYGGTTYSGSPGTVLNQSLSLDSPLKRQLKLYN